MIERGGVTVQRTVFVSYARKDSERIQQAVALLEAGGATVFRDIDDIEFGDEWEEVIIRKLEECERVMVFWSIHAQASEWVGKEYTIALAQQKRMVPVLLDDTPLPAELGKYHALTHFMPGRSSWKKYAGWAAGGVVLTVLAGVVALPTLQQPSSLSKGEPLVADSVNIPSVSDAGQQQRPEPAMKPVPRSSSSVKGQQSAATSDTPVTTSALATDKPVVFQYQYQTNSKNAGGVVGEGSKEVTPETGASAPVSLEPAINKKPLPLFAWGAGLLSLLLLLLFWFRNRSDVVSVREDAGKAFVDMVFDEKESG